MKLKNEQADAEPVEIIHDAAMCRWASRCDVLVTCLCMGGMHYACERDSLGPDMDAPLRERTSTVGTVMVRPTLYRHDHVWRDRIAVKADKARRELSAQTGIPIANWAALAEKVKKDKRLIGWLCGIGLMPIRPRIDRKPPQRGSRVTDDDRKRNADSIARDLV